jgi:DNA-binding PadR family transcriptional regulator
VLQVLASSEHLGLTEAVMMAYGSSASMLAGMLSDGFVTATVEKGRIGNHTVKVRRYRITDAGRKAIEDAMWRR